MMVSQTCLVVLAFLLLCGEQFAQKISFGSNQTFHIPCIKRKGLGFSFPGDRESYLHISKAQSHTAKFSCRRTLTVPDGKFISLKISTFQTSAFSCKNLRIKMTIFSLSLQPNKRTVDIYPCDRSVMYHMDHNEAKMFIQGKVGHYFSVTITVRALDQDGAKKLNVSHYTDFSGAITPYGFDGYTNYAVCTKGIAKLCFSGTTAILSFPHFHIKESIGCLDSSLRLVTGGRFVKWRRCGTLQLPAEVHWFKSSPMSITFFVHQDKGYTGLKIRFSFHVSPDNPKRLFITDSSGGLFNCSVPFYDKFRLHLDCNLETECLRAEDEVRCPYYRGACMPDFLNAGSKCYKYVKTMKVMTWYDAFSVCLEQGLVLASMPTWKQFDSFCDDILRFAPSPFNVFIGLRTSDPSLSAMYREVWQWSSRIMSYYTHVEEKVFKPTCISLAALSREPSPTMCGFYEHIQYIFCESETRVTLNKHRQVNLPPLDVSTTFGIKESTRFVTCSEGHLMHDFLSCDQMSRCGAEFGVTSCLTYRAEKSDTGQSSLKVLMYICDSSQQTIHYSQVCDYQEQCFDSSDESFCIHQECLEKQCRNGQCVSETQWCDGMAHCSDGSDEDCYQFVTRSTERSSSSKSDFRVVLFDGHGKYRYTHQSRVCPPTHFLCADGELCIPMYLRCNGVRDCSDGEDEDNCDDDTCPGYYRCRGTAVCVHEDHVCDDVFQCPQQDDELLCQLTCPSNCSCQGLAFVCSRPFPVEKYSDLRFLDSSHSVLTPDRLFHIHYLIRLSLASCGLYDLPVLNLTNLKFLDLGNNLLTNISMHVFFKLSNLNFVSLSRNPLTTLAAPKSSTLLVRLYAFDLSHTKLGYFDSEIFYSIPNMKSLNLSYGTTMVIRRNGFGHLTHIETLDLRGTDLKHYPAKMLQSLTSLREVFSDVYRFCCRDLLPRQLKSKNCHTVSEEIASCKDLLQSDIYRMFLWSTCCIALVGNVVCFSYRLYTQKGRLRNSFNVFITHLNVADTLMGLYLIMVGSADLVYRGVYLLHDKRWKKSAACKAAGFFSLLSSETSAFIICFITLDRILAIHYPFGHVRFGNTSAHMVCGLSWAVGISLASLPLLPVMSHWAFYSQSDICIPLPITRENFKGRSYSFGILIVFNFFLFILIAVGQVFIYISIRTNSIATDQKNAREATAARRLLTVVMSEFLCWFPIGVLGLLASNGVSIPGEINVAMATFVLPINSALNPFLYTLNVMKEKRQKASELRLLKLLQIKYSTLQ